jgi:DNA polymerase-3 subunit gamma/tau
MSYQVLARKWRPQQFGQLVGQDHVKSALTHALSQNRLHHAYLFTGTRGVGKTTIARIFAKSLNCEQGVTATPCGQCSACREIDAGFFVDLLEIDAASRTKVEDTRDLLDNVQYAPTRGRYKVYLIDEVHMLSKHSFNALLKTLEEPPPHVKFLLATTDPQKLPITVLSRCLQFSLKALTQAQIKQHLSYVLEQEQIPAEEDALALLARAAKGSLRDSLSLTDQAIAQTGGQITLGPVREMLGYLEQSWAEILLQSVLNRDLAAMQRHLYQLLSSHPQCQSVLDDMLALLHLAALAQYQLNAAELALTESAFVRAVAKSQSPELIQLYYQLLLSGKKDLPYAPDPRTGLEMALLRAIAFVPATSATVDNPVPSARAAALTAAGIPAEPTAVQAILAAPTHMTPAQSIPAQTTQVHSAVSNNTSQQNVLNQVPEQHSQSFGHDAFESARADDLSMTAITSPQLQTTAQPLQAESLQPAATQAASTQPANSEPVIDPVTASIMARRGLLPSGESAGGKKPERQQAPVTPQAAPIVSLPTRAPIAASIVAPVVTTSAPAMAAVVAPVAKPPMVTPSPIDPMDIPPWQDQPIVTATEVTDADSALVDEPETFEPAVISRGANLGVPFVAHDDSELEELSEESPDSAAEQFAADATWQVSHNIDNSATHVEQNQAQPIRHALLESVPVQIDTDFASEEVLAQAPIVDAGPLYFDGVIEKGNFALRTSSQVDAWAARIDSLKIGGLMRLFLLHSVADLQGDSLSLTVASSQRHLDSERNRAQLKQVLSESFALDLAIDIQFVDEVLQSPQALQLRIDQARRVYVEQVLRHDPLVLQLQQHFAAEWQADSLSVN